MYEHFDIDLKKASFEWALISARLATVPEKERYKHGENDFG